MENIYPLFSDNEMREGYNKKSIKRTLANRKREDSEKQE